MGALRVCWHFLVGVGAIVLAPVWIPLLLSFLAVNGVVQMGAIICGDAELDDDEVW